jgi:hypothetical protein
MRDGTIPTSPTFICPKCGGQGAISAKGDNTWPAVLDIHIACPGCNDQLYAHGGPWPGWDVLQQPVRRPSLRDWERAIDTLLSSLTKFDWISPGTNVLGAAPPKEHVEELRKDLEGRDSQRIVNFYALHDGLSFPDVHNGIFVHSIEWLLHRQVRDAPRSLRRGHETAEIFAFGSDGGGSFFAADWSRAGRIMRLPPDAIRERSYLAGERAVDVASDFDEFLQFVLFDLMSFAAGSKDARWLT